MHYRGDLIHWQFSQVAKSDSFPLPLWQFLKGCNKRLAQSNVV
jgi:hypothetical protein